MDGGRSLGGTRISDADRGPTGLAWRLQGVVRLVHPFPSALVAGTVVLLGLAAARGAPDWPRLLAAGAAMLLLQFWVGALNDLCDRDLDASTKPWKPLASGCIPSSCAAAIALVLLGTAAVLVLPLGAAAAGLLAAAAVPPLAYNVRLKRTRWSWVPFVAFFPLIPLYTWAALDRFIPELVLAYPLGALLGVGVHLANAVPDLEGDAAHRAGGLAVRLGRTGALVTSWGSLAAAQAAGLGTGLWLGFRPGPLIGGVALSVALLVSSALVSRGCPGPSTLRVNFALVALSAVALGVGWLSGASWR